MRSVKVPLLLLSTLLFGCVAAEPPAEPIAPPSSFEGPPADLPRVDVGLSSPGLADLAPQVQAPAIEAPALQRGPNVLQVVDLGAPFACDEVGNRHCVDDYLDLAATLYPADAADVEDCIDEVLELSERAIKGDPVLPGPYADHLSVDELADRVLEATALDQWLAGVDERPLLVTVVRDTGAEQRLLFTDGLAGTFEVRLLVPQSAAPWPAIIGAPGHPSSDEAIDDFVDLHGGREYASAGYAVADVGFRGFDSGFSEHRATGELLCTGWSLTAMRAYELQLVHKYLRWLTRQGLVDGVALIGHSEGSTTGNVVARTDPRLHAYVSDNITSYLNVQPCSQDEAERCLIGENTPALFEHHLRMNDLNMPAPWVPTLEQDYGYPDGPEPVLQFLAEHLPEPTPLSR